MNAYITAYEISPALPPARPKRIVTRPSWLPRREEILPRKWSLAALATVALVAITLTIFFFNLRDTNQPAVVPGTPVGSPTAIPAPTTTVVPVSMYRGGLDRTGVMPGPAPSGRPGVLWHVDRLFFVNGPVVVGNGLVYAGTDDGSVHAFDMTTGAEVWKLTGHTTFASPTIVLDGMTAYIAGYDDMLLAVDAATGNEIWRTDPALNVSRLVAFDAESKTLYVGGRDPVSYAFDSATGQLKWQVDITAPQKSVASIVIGDTLYFGATDGMLYALNTADGSIRWTWDSTFEMVRSLTYANNTIFAPATSARNFAFVAIDASTGVERWRLSSTKGEYAAAGVVDGNIILGTDIVGEVISVSQMDGRVNWTFAPGSRGFRAPPAIVGDMVYVADKEGSFYALDAVTGQEIWRLQLDSWVDYDPAITDGVIYIGTMAGSVYALGDGGTELPAATPAAGRATPSAPLWTESGKEQSAESPASPEASPGPATVEADMELLWGMDGGDGGLDGQGNVYVTASSQSRLVKLRLPQSLATPAP